jgi:hypothetical protein
MRRNLVRLAVSLIALGAICSLTLGGTVSGYTATTTIASNTFAAAPDWTAPDASSAPIGRTTAYDTGFIKQGASYYVYANVADSGNPASGIASVKANVTSLTTGSSAVALTSGSYSAGGTTYNYRSPALTAGTSLATGTYTYMVTSTDSAGNTATQSFTTAVDNTTPTATDVQSTNVSGGTVGHFDLGDTFTLTYSGIMDPYSILSGWTGAATDVQVALVDGGGTASDSIYVYDTAASPAQIPIGIVTLGTSGYVSTGGGSYVTFGATGAATPSTMVRVGASITITLGTPSATTLKSTTAAKMTWAPSTTATDIAGNPASGTSVTQTGTVHVNF